MVLIDDWIKQEKFGWKPGKTLISLKLIKVEMREGKPYYITKKGKKVYNNPRKKFNGIKLNEFKNKNLIEQGFDAGIYKVQPLWYDYISNRPAFGSTFCIVLEPNGVIEIQPKIRVI